MIYRGQIEVNALDFNANDLNNNAIGVKNGVNCSGTGKNIKEAAKELKK